MLDAQPSYPIMLQNSLLLTHPQNPACTATLHWFWRHELLIELQKCLKIEVGRTDRYIRRNQVRSGDAKEVADFRVTEWFSLKKQSNNKLLTNKIFLLCCYWWLHLIFMQSSGTHSFLLGDLWARFAHAYHTLSARKMAAINDESFIHWILSLLVLEYWHN